VKRYECNYCNNDPCVFVSSTSDNPKPGLCPIVEPDGEPFDGVDWQSAPLKAESAEKSDNSAMLEIALILRDDMSRRSQNVERIGAVVAQLQQ